MKDPYGGAEIPVFVPSIGDDTLRAVEEAFEIGWLGMGATTRAFEEAIGAFLETDRPVVATNTGTAALHVACVAAGLGPGDEVIVPSFNFVADHQAITATGAEPVFCDILEDGLGIDPGKAAELVSERTKAVMPLHFAGIPCRIEEIEALAARHGLRVIEDATHAFGTERDDRRIGAQGDLVCFSFDPVKVITSIDGGAIIVPDEGTAQKVRHLRLLGIDRDTEARYRNQRAWEYDVVSSGFRYHLTNINASIGLSQLARVNEFIVSRRESCRRYGSLLSDLDEVIAPTTDFDGVSPFIYAIRVPASKRTDLIAFLRDRGIATGIHFLPAHRFAFYRDRRRGDLSVTEKVADEILTLPLHSNMPTAMVDRIANEIRRFFGR